MFGKKKPEESPCGNQGKSAEQQMMEYAFKQARKQAEEDPEYRKRLIERFIGDAEFQPDDSIKRAIAELKAQTEVIKANNARIEAELRRKALDKIISSPELTDRWVKAEIERQTAIRSPLTGMGDQHNEPQRQAGGRYVSPFRQALDILNAARDRQKILKQQGNSSRASKRGSAAPPTGGAGLRRMADQLKDAAPVGGTQRSEAPAAAKEQPAVAADSSEQTELVSENGRLACEQTRHADELHGLRLLHPHERHQR